MRTVFPARELPHMWAHQTAFSGRTPGRANESFAGDIYYSYSAPIGRLITRRGVTAYLLTQRVWSVTTSRHQSFLRRAIPADALILYCHTIGDTPAAMLAYCLERAATAANKAERARKYKDQHLGDQAAWLDHARDVAKFYSLRNKIDSTSIDRLRAAQKRAAAKTAAKRQAARTAV